MDRYIDFTVDDVKYKGLGDWVDELHKRSIRFMPIIDAGISLNRSNAGDNWYEIGNGMDVFIKTTKNPTKKDGNLIATVWPGYTAFVDFFKEQGYEFWKQGLDKLYSLVQFDGIWLDMNEPANFWDEGEWYPPAAPYLYDELNKQENVWVSDSPVKPGEFENLQYTPGGGQLYNKTISMDAYFTDKDENGTFAMYNVHSLYATLETMATQKYLQSKFTNRTFVLSRGSFVGHGKYGTMWTGDIKK